MAVAPEAGLAYTSSTCYVSFCKAICKIDITVKYICCLISVLTRFPVGRSFTERIISLGSLN